MEPPERRKDGMGGRQADKRRDVRREKRAARAWIGKVSQTVLLFNVCSVSSLTGQRGNFYLFLPSYLTTSSNHFTLNESAALATITQTGCLRSSLEKENPFVNNLLNKLIVSEI